MKGRSAAGRNVGGVGTKRFTKAILSLVASLVVATPMIGMTATPAAAVSEGTATCTLDVPGWPATGGGGTCTGTVTGVAPFSAPGLCVQCPFSLEVSTLVEPCAPAVPIPPVGTASGSVSVSGQVVGGFLWARLGAVLVFLPLDPGTFAGVGAWVPLTPIPTCAAPGTLRAVLVIQE
jgi:hypothetical protein